MRKKPIAVLLVFFLLLPVAFAIQHLPAPGLLPDSPFYGFKRLFETVGTLLTFGEDAKLYRTLELAEKRLAEAEAMVLKGKTEFLVSLAKDYEAEVGRANEIAALSKEAADRERLSELVVKTTSGHATVLNDVLERVPEQVKPAIQRAINKSIAGKDKILESLREPRPEKAEETGETKQRTEETTAGKQQQETDLRVQYSALKDELINARSSGSLLSEEHYKRIMRDLDALESAGYTKGDIDELRSIATELVPYLKDVKTPQSDEPSSKPSPAASKCIKGSQKPQLTADITNFSKIRKITAPGSPSFEGPKGHSFIWTEHEHVPVYMPTDAILESGSYSKDTEDSPAQYLLLFVTKENCDYQLKFDHIDELNDSILRQFPSTPKVADSRTSEVSDKIEFKAGDLIGYTRGTPQAGNWDFGLYYMAELGVLGKQHDSYGLHGYAVCWVDFYVEGKIAQYRALLEGPKLLCSF